MRSELRRALAFFLPAAVLLTLTCGLVYGEVQQDLRNGADDPQVQLAEDAAARLDAGSPPASVVGSVSIDLGRTLSPFVAIYDPAGTVLATDGRLDGRPPAPPIGVLTTAAAKGRDRVTWQPQPGVRIALVVVPWRGGTVAAGRSLRLVEEREDQALLLAAAAWLVGLGGLALAALVAGRIWPRSPGSADDAATSAPGIAA
jgi:hypothetical protein